LPAIPSITPVFLTEAPTVSTDVLTASLDGKPFHAVINPPGDNNIDLQNSFIQTANNLGAEAIK
jgi:hypothetical protein